MLLHTPLYLSFLAVVVLLYWLLPRQSWKKTLLLLASYAFYAFFDVRFLLLLILLTGVTFYLGKAIHRGVHPRRFMWTSIIVNLGILGVFKYLGFFLSSLNPLLQSLGMPSSPGLMLLLPVGISFYTFQAISYTIEIYRRTLEPSDRIVDFALYLAFFPKLIAGPYVRPVEFLNQVARPAERLCRPEVASALGLLLLGLVKKIVIADGLASQADVAFRAAALSSNDASISFLTPLYLQGFYLYAFQIYADFSGYTDLARASAALLGFRLPENFQQPYLAPTVASFWNRWHITLTMWFREYLFFPLSRSLLVASHRRYPRGIQTAANLITMTVIGFWHGAAWTYIAWGLWHGILLTGERLLGWKPNRRWTGVLSGVITFHLVGLGWILFRSPSFAAAGEFLQGLVSFYQMEWLVHYLPSILITAALVFGLDLFQSGRIHISSNRSLFLRRVMVVAAVFVLGFLFVLQYARGSDIRPFIYGQF